MKIITVTDRKIARGPFEKRIEDIAKAGTDMIILRERDLTEDEYGSMMRMCQRVCGPLGVEVCANRFDRVARELGVSLLQIPAPVLRKAGKPTGFRRVGVSVHSTEEAGEAVKLGADHLIAGPVFPTSCKPDARPRGVGFIGEIVSSTDVPVYAIGGIDETNIRQMAEAGAAGVCIRSPFMESDDIASFVKGLRAALG